MATNRWLNGAFPAIGIHISIGAVYAWSVFANPVMEVLDANLSQVQWAFSIAIFFLGMSAAFLGEFVEKIGPRNSGIICGICYGLGLVGSGFAISQHSLLLLYLFYGVIGGIGLGVGYITPVKTLVNWFYDRPGLATGLAIMGFGFASAVAGPLINFLIEHNGLINTFFILGALYFLIIIISSLCIKPAPFSQSQNNADAQENYHSRKKQYSVKEAVRTWQFYALWFMLFINITCGIALVSVASPLLQETTGVSAVLAASIVGIMGIFNGGGRLFWATISDYLGRDVVYTLFFILEIIAMLLLGTMTHTLLFQILLFIVMTCYGGGFSCIPAYLSDVYGTKQLSAIHGRILTAWAMAGIAGPAIIAWSKSITSSYQNTMFIFAGLFASALIVSILVMTMLRKNNRL